MRVVFWVCLFIVFYSYIGYGILLYIIVRLKRLFRGRAIERGGVYEPAVTLIVAAYNEEEFVRRKVANTLELDYPADKLEIVFVTDGSTDGTPGILRGYDRIRVMHEPGRSGKAAAMNRAMRTVRTPIVVFCDANALLNREAIRNLVRHYRDPRVGGVAGEKKISADATGKAAAAGEGLYWKYESALKSLDAQLYTVVGAAGELFSLRTEFYEEMHREILLDDFVLSMKVCQKGFRVEYEPDAFAIETSSQDMKEERKRKVRISAGAFQSILLLRDLLNPFAYPLVAFQFVSHRVLRWTITPVCLVLVLLANTILVGRGAGIVYSVLLAGQLLFYALAFTGWVLANRGSKSRVLFVPYYLLFMNVSVFMGFYRWCKGGQSVLWEKARRNESPINTLIEPNEPR